MSKFGLTSYINAILELGNEVNNLKLFIELSNDLLVITQEEPMLVKFLADYNVDLQEKREILVKAFNQKKADLYIKWILILIADGVVNELRFILESVIDLYNKSQGIITGTIWTTSALAPEQIVKFNNLVSKKVGLKTNLVNKLDQEILGGIKIEIGDHIWDNTISKRLQNLTYELLKKG